MEHIETRRLLLRPFKSEDAEAASCLSRKPSVAYFLSDMVLETADDARRWIAWLESRANLREPFQLFALERKADQQIIGLAGTGPKRELGGEIEILYAIADEYQKCGYATEAAEAVVWWVFERAGQDMLSAIVKPENPASRRVIEKLGFIYCDTRTLPHDGESCAFDYFRLYHLDTLPGPDWRGRVPAPPERMDAFFDARAEGYNDHMLGEGSKATYELLGGFLPRTDEALQLLDPGCGTGLELPYIWRQFPNAHITCMDVSQGMLDILLKSCPDRKSQLTVIRGDYLTWDYPAEAFDIVVSCNTMHHFTEEQKTAVYRSFRHALKPGGVYLEDDFIVEAAAAEQYRRRYEALTASLGGGVAGEYHIDIPFTIETQTRLLTDAGFRSVEVLYECLRPRGSGAILQAGK